MFWDVHVLVTCSLCDMIKSFHLTVSKRMYFDILMKSCERVNVSFSGPAQKRSEIWNLAWDPQQLPRWLRHVRCIEKQMRIGLCTRAKRHTQLCPAFATKLLKSNLGDSVPPLREEHASHQTGKPNKLIIPRCWAEMQETTPTYICNPLYVQTPILDLRYVLQVITVELRWLLNLNFALSEFCLAIL